MSSSELNCGTSLRASSHSSLPLLRLDDDESENTASSRTHLNLGGSSSNNHHVGHHRTRNTDGGASSKRTLLADMPVTEELTLLRRREIEIGTVLGRGRYSEVHSIQRIHLNNTAENLDNTPPEQQQQQQQQQQQLDQEGKQQRYVMKHIQNKLFANRGHRRWQRDLTNAIADLVTEAMYLSKLNHPHIIRLRGLTRGGTSVLKRPGANGEDYFLLLDRMEETLDYRIHQRWKKMYYSSSSSSSSAKKKPRQSYDLVMTKIRYSHQMAQALSYLHDHQIIFRDYKPENCGFVLQDAKLSHTDPHRDRLQLFDFGLARELDEPPPPTPPLLPPPSSSSESSSSADQQQQQPRTPERLYSLSASGTRRYMAPEIFNGRQYNYKADVYSWAIVFFESLSHVKPFADFTTQSHEELVCRLGGRPKLREIDWPDNINNNDNSTVADDANATAQATDGTPSSLSDEIESLLQRAWNQDLYQRPSMARVCMELEDLLKRRQGSSSTKETTGNMAQAQAAAAAAAAAAYSSSSSSSTATTIQEVHRHMSAAPATTSSTNTSNNNEDVNPFLQKKTSTSELTSATDPMASDSEEVSLFDDNSHPNNTNNNSSNGSSNNNTSRTTRWSHSSGRSSISSFGGIPSH